MTLGEFAEAVATYCLLRGGSITSWGRSEKHNAAVGGVPGSAHRFFRGADVVYDAAAPLAARQTDALRLKLKLIDEGDHDHLQPLDWPAG
jgi:hypothetical protein